ncbi:hypothetical protein OG423_23365 [Micromonospora zamorensis]|uniref:Uncharacterized protein n=1 Tax=Micromonospora zamorensis TaxID=709883 RepID=A0ABZ1P8M4_9ACTN|nr:hypothetical protein OG423_23365 [Micromonospora zamorensis]
MRLRVRGGLVEYPPSLAGRFDGGAKGSLDLANAHRGGRCSAHLVVEARRQGPGFGWAIRYEVPGSPVPSGPPGWHRDLPEVLTHTDVANALTGLTERGRAVPARLLRPDSPRPPVTPAVDVDQLERRVLADCVDPGGGDELPGAQALWRDGRWWHTTLRPGEPVEILAEQPTGR